jgi:heterodisulfide reductase subunit A
LFRETVREAGLNIYLFEMANIRDQCSWVHMHQPEEATKKSKDLVRSAVAKARLLKPLPKPVINVVQEALVIGGGLSGLTAARELAKQGFGVHLVEREKQLGGFARNIHYLIGPQDPQKQLDALIEEVKADPKIHVYLNTDVSDIKGYIGNFKTTLKMKGRKKDKEIEHGAVIIATGALEYRPSEYFYANDPRVMTQHELEEKLAKGDFNAKMVVMIQCVGSRNEQNPNCSRICCTQAVKNSLKIKELNPDADIYVLYKDMRTFGFKEDYYREASEKGVLFVRYDDEHKPEVQKGEERLTVTAWEPVLKTWIPIETDLLVLSVATVANPDNERLAGMLKVPLTKDKFFLEAHMKLRPVDFATDGVFLCGMAHSPKFIDESISQACAAASRAATVLSKPSLEMEGSIASVDQDLCSGCKICESVCAYNAIEMEQKSDKEVAKVLEALCKGCGVCGSSCPTKAITLGHFTNEQILAQVKATLKEEIAG